jgi:hypothetical protein
MSIMVEYFGREKEVSLNRVNHTVLNVVQAKVVNSQTTTTVHTFSILIERNFAKSCKHTRPN